MTKRERGAGAQTMQQTSYTIDFSRDEAEQGDYIFFYGNSSDGYGGIFDKNHKIKGSVS
jgi:hypothetical protein